MYLESILLLASVAVAVPYLCFSIVISLMNSPSDQDDRKNGTKSKPVNSSALVAIPRAQKTTTIVAPTKVDKTVTLVYRGAPMTKNSSIKNK